MQDRRVLAGTDDRRVAGARAAVATERVVDQRFELVLEHAGFTGAHREQVRFRRNLRRLAQR